MNWNNSVDSLIIGMNYHIRTQRNTMNCLIIFQEVLVPSYVSDIKACKIEITNQILGINSNNLSQLF
jgi:hypothetical protein